MHRQKKATSIYRPSDINWAQFGREAEALCKGLCMDYYIKDSLRAEMEKC